MRRRELTAAIPKYSGQKLDNWANYKRKLVMAISNSLHPYDDPDGQNLAILSGLEGVAEVQAQQVILYWGTMTPARSWKGLLNWSSASTSSWPKNQSSPTL